MKTVIFIFPLFIGHIFALKCFQGTLNTALSTRTGDAINCPNSDDIACVMKYDSAQKNANYMCSKNNCSVNGVVIRESVCVNVSTTQKNCCCYSEACSYWFLSDLPPVLLSPSDNAATLVSSNASNIATSLTTFGPSPTTPASLNNSNSTTSLSTPKPSSTSTLKCLQGPMNVTDPKNMNLFDSPLSAPVCADSTAVTCQSQYDSLTKFVTFSCSNQNCSLNGHYVRDSVCVNVSTSQWNCCCYTDGCTSTSMANNLKPRSSNFNNSPMSPPRSASTGSLKCLQGPLNVTHPSSLEMISSPSAATFCMDPLAATCITQFDPTRNISVFSCSTSNCTLNGMTISQPMSVNRSATEHNYCCYGDACSSWQMAQRLKLNTTLPAPIGITTGVTIPKPPPTGPLKCLQGSLNVSQPSSLDMIASPSAATACMDPLAATCSTQFDPTRNISVFSCSTSNCTLNGVTISQPMCVNRSLTEHNCCCYGDACSSAQMLDRLKMSTTLFPFTIPKPSNGTLRCLQGSMNLINQSALNMISSPSAATACMDPNAVACRTFYDPISNIANFSCITSMCNLNGKTVSDTACNVLDASLGNMSKQDCCCYGDGCSSALTAKALGLNTTSIASNSTAVTTMPKPPLNGTLKCLQGSVNTTFPITGTPEFCKDPAATSCRIQYDTSSKFAVFSCSNLNCTLNNIVLRDAMCINVTTFQRQCCCYGDGCNALSLREEFAKDVLSGSNVTTPRNVSNVALPAIRQSPLKCVQGSVNTTNQTLGPATTCTDPNAISCLTQIDKSLKQANFSCHVSNCTVNGNFISGPSCVNISTYQTSCCCITDECNMENYSSLKVTLFAPSNTSTNNITKNITSSLTTRDATSGCENGYKILSSSADTSIAGKGKFAGYLGYRSSCQELCDKSFGLVKCVAYMFELHNRGKCTLFHQPVDSDVVEILNSGATVAAKC